MSINGYELQETARQLSMGLTSAAMVLRQQSDRELYTHLHRSGTKVRVVLNQHVGALMWSDGEITKLTDTGICLETYDPDESDEPLLRLFPYSSVLYIIELPPESENDE